MYDDEDKKPGEIPDVLLPIYMAKSLRAMKAPRAVKRITFGRTEAFPGGTLYVSVPKLNEYEMLVPGSLALRFDVDLEGGHANNFLVQNATQDTVGFDIYNTFEDLFLPVERRDNVVPEGIQSEDLCKIRSKAGDEKTSGVAAENKLNEIFGSKYCIRLDHQILTGHGVFYPQALYNDLMLEMTLATVSQVVRGSDPTKLKYKLTNIQFEYEMIRTKFLGAEALSVYEVGKEFAYDHVMRHKVVTFKKETTSRLNSKVDAQRRSMKGILLLFVEPYAVGGQDSEKFIFPDITKVSVTINGSPNMLHNEGIESKDMWAEASLFFVKEKSETEHMTPQKVYTGNRFGLLIDLRSMADQTMHGSGTQLVNTTDGVQLEIERKTPGSENVNCHIFLISDSQFNIMDRQPESVQF